MTVLNSKNYYVKLNLIVTDISKFVKIPMKKHETHLVDKKENSISYNIREYIKEYRKKITTS